MNEDTGFALGTFPASFSQPRMALSVQKIHDGVENACLEILNRIEQKKETATDKELIDLSMCLSGLITAWNLSSLRAGYSAYPPYTPCFGSTDAEGGAS